MGRMREDDIVNEKDRERERERERLRHLKFPCTSCPRVEDRDSISEMLCITTYQPKEAEKIKFAVSRNSNLVKNWIRPRIDP